MSVLLLSSTRPLPPAQQAEVDALNRAARERGLQELHNAAAIVFGSLKTRSNMTLVPPPSPSSNPPKPAA